jgi:signal transduction histidine kinase
MRTHLRTAVLYLGVWTLLALLSASQLILTYAYADTGAVNGRAVVLITALLWYTWAALAPLVIWLARRLPLGTGRTRRNLGAHVGLNVLFAFGAVAIYRTLRAAIGLPSARPFSMELITGIHTQVLTYWILVGIVHITEYYRRARERDVRAAELEAELSRARLDALRMQLHPHFLFNTMHAISAAIREDPEGAEDMLAELADLLRATLERPAAHEVSLREELEFIQRYVGIQKVRFGDRLDVVLSVQEDALDARVPSLILQPLVENAIEHGIATRLRGGRLEIRVQALDGGLVLSVADDGPGIADPERSAGTERLGLRNTRARLAHLYGDQAGLELRNRADGGLCANVHIPLRPPAPASS